MIHTARYRRDYDAIWIWLECCWSTTSWLRGLPCRLCWKLVAIRWMWRLRHRRRLDKLDQQEYELVLSDLRKESVEAGAKLLAYARVKAYKPATALITAYHDSKMSGSPWQGQEVSIQAEDVVNLLSKVAYLIGLRASKRAGRACGSALCRVQTLQADQSLARS